MKGPFTQAIEKAENAVRNRSTMVHPGRWQSIDVSKRPEAVTHEVLNYTLSVPVPTEDRTVLADDIKPNLPWADDHFEERVSGEPLNPGVEWAHWPWGNSADKFRNEPMPNGEKGFSHTYMERMWPRQANMSDIERDNGRQHTGVRYYIGDAYDVVTHLAREPLSRQAYLPIWFPEDTGKVEVRVPCTLGYHFIMRHGFLHCTYYIRSCDLMRHFRDDIYLTVRLQLWMLQKLRQAQTERMIDGHDWHDVKPGLFTMHIVSLHLFRNDYLKMFNGA